MEPKGTDHRRYQGFYQPAHVLCHGTNDTECRQLGSQPELSPSEAAAGQSHKCSQTLPAGLGENQSRFPLRIRVPGRSLQPNVYERAAVVVDILFLCRPGRHYILPRLDRPLILHRRRENQGDRYPQSAGGVSLENHFPLLAEFHETGHHRQRRRLARRICGHAAMASGLCLPDELRNMGIYSGGRPWPIHHSSFCRVPDSPGRHSESRRQPAL